MSTLMKVLLGLALVVPMGAYVVGSLVASSSGPVAGQSAVVVPAPLEERVVEPGVRFEKRPVPQPDPGDDDADDDADDDGSATDGGTGGGVVDNNGVELVTPEPQPVPPPAGDDDDDDDDDDGGDDDDDDGDDD